MESLHDQIHRIPRMNEPNDLSRWCSNLSVPNLPPSTNGSTLLYFSSLKAVNQLRSSRELSSS
jgi:hypothetical protein